MTIGYSVAEFRMGVDERRQAVQRRDELGRLRRQTEQLSYEVLLGPADVAGDAPEQIDRDVDRCSRARGRIPARGGG